MVGLKSGCPESLTTSLCSPGRNRRSKSWSGSDSVPSLVPGRLAVPPDCFSCIWPIQVPSTSQFVLPQTAPGSHCTVLVLVPHSTRGSLRVLKSELSSESSLQQCCLMTMMAQEKRAVMRISKEVTHARWKVRRAKVNSSGFSNRWDNDFPNNCRSSYPGTGTFWG